MDPRFPGYLDARKGGALWVVEDHEFGLLWPTLTDVEQLCVEWEVAASPAEWRAAAGKTLELLSRSQDGSIARAPEMARLLAGYPKGIEALAGAFFGLFAGRLSQMEETLRNPPYPGAGLPSGDGLRMLRYKVGNLGDHLRHAIFR